MLQIKCTLCLSYVVYVAFESGIPKSCAVGSSWNVMAHGDAREGKWRGNLRMEWIASTLYTTSEHGVSTLLPLMSTLRMPVADWTGATADLNGLVRFAQRRKLFCARAITFHTQSTTKILFMEPRVCECLYGSVTRRKGKFFGGPEHYFIKKCKGTEVRGLFQVGLLCPWRKAPGLPWIRDRVGLTVCLSVGVC